MIYFLFKGNYCKAEYINDDLASRVIYITKEEYDKGIEEQEKEEEENKEE